MGSRSPDDRCDRSGIKPLLMTSPTAFPVPTAIKRFWPIILLALLPLIPLSRAILSGEAIGPFDQIRQMAPWNGSKPAQPWDVLEADGVLQFYVWRDLVFDSWGKGQLPFWNAYQLGGNPLLANSQSAGLYPPHILAGILHLGTASAMTLLAWFHLFWAGLGTYYLAKRLGANRVGAVIAGSSFSLSNFMIAWTGLPSVIETVSWIPWSLAFCAILWQTAPERKKQLAPGRFVVSSVHKYWLHVAGLAMSVSMLILAGHLQFAAYGFIALGLFAVWLTLTSDRSERASTLKACAHMLLGLVLGVCIAAPHLLSVLQYSQFSHRRNTPTEVGYHSFVDSAIQPYELIKVFVPTLQGNPRQLADGVPVSTYYPALLKPGANFAESAIGLGLFTVLLLALLPFFAKRNEPIWGIIITGLVGFLIAIGSPVDRLFYFGVPGWSSTGSPGRAICLFVLAASVGAGLAASRLEAVADIRRKLSFGLGGLAIAIVACAFLMNGYQIPKMIDPEIIRNLKGQAESAAISGCMGILVLSPVAIGLAVFKRSMLTKCLLVAVPILSSIAFLGTSLIQTGTPDLKVTHNLGTQRIATINNAWDIFSAQHATLPPNLATLNRIHSIDGYDSLLHRDTVAMLREIDGDRDPAPAANGNMMFVKPSADLKKLADAGVTEVWSQRPIKGLSNPTEESGVLKYRLDGPGRASTPQGQAEIQSETTTGMKIHAMGPGKLIVRERNMPGWIAHIDGMPAAVSGTTWMEFDLTAGDHQVELNYVPPGFMSGIFLAVIALIAMLALAVGPRFLSAKLQKPEPS